MDPRGDTILRKLIYFNVSEPTGDLEYALDADWIQAYANLHFDKWESTIEKLPAPAIAMYSAIKGAIAVGFPFIRGKINEYLVSQGADPLPPKERGEDIILYLMKAVTPHIISMARQEEWCLTADDNGVIIGASHVPAKWNN